MDNMSKKTSFRVMVMLLAVLVCLSFMPVFDGAVSAKSAGEKVAEKAQDDSEIKAAETAKGTQFKTASAAQKILNSKQKTKVGKKSDKSFNKAIAKLLYKMRGKK